jgi:hypothetical protein
MTTRDVEGWELGPRRRSGRDFGLVVGVDHYPRFRSLQGAAADAIAFHAWMCDPDGGGVAPAHARLVTSTPEPPTPLQDHVDEQVVELVQAADALGGARRLYVYFSGHGATCLDGAADDVALLLAKWSPALARLALSTSRYCSALGGLGLFEEVAMFLDCCRGAAVGAVGLPPTFTCKPASAGPPARVFVAYATEAGRPAFEQPREGVWHGAFTRRLLWILKRSPQGIEAAALKDSLERELREDAVQRAHVVNGLSAGSRFGRRGAPPILEVKPDDEWEGEVELYDGMGQLVARHRPTEGTWTLPLAAGLYKLTYGVGGQRLRKLVDHGATGPTSLDFRPRLIEPIVRVWNMTTADRWIPAIDDMQVFKLPQDEPLYIGSAPECAIRVDGQIERSCDARIRREGECYVIEDLGTSHSTLFHGRIRDLRDSTILPGGDLIRSKQLHDGDLFRCGELRLLVGHVEDPPGGMRGRDVMRRMRMGIEFRMPVLTSPTWTAVSRLLLGCASGVSVTVYDATGAVRGQGEGGLEILLPRGLYRIEAELFDHVRSRVIELDDDTHLGVESPSISTPATMISDDRNWHRVPASIYSARSTTAPLGAAPQTSRLLVLLRRAYELRTSPEWPSEPVSILDGNERLLAELSRRTGHVGRDRREKRRFLAFSCEVAPGAYCLRASRSRRNVAITIPAGYAARIFVADVGTVRLDDMRVSLVSAAPSLRNYPNYAALTRTMEDVITALRSPGRGLSNPARTQLRTLIRVDLCFGIAAAHLLARAEDREALEEVLDVLAPHVDIPDVAILQHAYRSHASDAAFALTMPPLLRASLQLAMSHPAFDLRGVPADSALARAASRGYADSIWCTWSHDVDDERWIAPTVAELRRDEPDVVALGRRLGIPPRRVQQALDELDAGPSDTARG